MTDDVSLDMDVTLDYTVDRRNGKAGGYAEVKPVDGLGVLVRALPLKGVGLDGRIRTEDYFDRQVGD